jgi:hypothetical protein
LCLGDVCVVYIIYGRLHFEVGTAEVGV